MSSSLPGELGLGEARALLDDEDPVAGVRERREALGDGAAARAGADHDDVVRPGVHARRASQPAGVRAITDRGGRLGPRVVAEEDERPQSPEAAPQEEDGCVFEGREEARALVRRERRERPAPAQPRQVLDRADERHELALHARRLFRERLLDERLERAPAGFVERRGLGHDRHGDGAERVADGSEQHGGRLTRTQRGYGTGPVLIGLDFPGDGADPRRRARPAHHLRPDLDHGPVQPALRLLHARGPEVPAASAPPDARGDPPVRPPPARLRRREDPDHRRRAHDPARPRRHRARPRGDRLSRAGSRSRRTASSSRAWRTTCSRPGSRR